MIEIKRNSDDDSIYYLSDEIYVISHHTEEFPFSFKKKLPIGTQIRLISGVNQSNTPGHHWHNNKMSTVCRVSCANPDDLEWLGIYKEEYKLLYSSPWKINLVEILTKAKQ